GINVTSHIPSCPAPTIWEKGIYPSGALGPANSSVLLDILPMLDPIWEVYVVPSGAVRIISPLPIPWALLAAVMVSPCLPNTEWVPWVRYGQPVTGFAGLRLIKNALYPRAPLGYRSFEPSAWVKIGLSKINTS